MKGTFWRAHWIWKCSFNRMPTLQHMSLSFFLPYLIFHNQLSGIIETWKHEATQPQSGRPHKVTEQGHQVLSAQKLCSGSSMAWVSTVKRLHANLTLPCVSWSGVKHAVTGLWSRINILQILPAWLHCANCEVWWRKGIAMGFFLRSRWKELLMLQHNKTFWTILCFQLWGNNLDKALFCSSMTMHKSAKLVPYRHGWVSSVWKNRPWPKPHQTPLGWTKTEFPLIQNQCLTSQMLLWMNGQTFPLTRSLILSNSILMSGCRMGCHEN